MKLARLLTLLGFLVALAGTILAKGMDLRMEPFEKTLAKLIK